MSVTDYTVKLVNREYIESFMEKWHYTDSINGVHTDYCFALLEGRRLIGASIYGRVAMPNAWRKFVDSEDEILELRRLACIDDTPKNTESFFIGQTLKWLIHNTLYKKIVSYADPEFGHEGIIYQATNFEYKGQGNPAKVIYWNDEMYHIRSRDNKYKGKLKPFAKKLRKALEDGEAYYKKVEGKHIYLYDLENRRSKQEKKRIENLWRGL